MSNGVLSIPNAAKIISPTHWTTAFISPAGQYCQRAPSAASDTP